MQTTDPGVQNAYMLFDSLWLWKQHTEVNGGRGKTGKQEAQLSQNEQLRDGLYHGPRVVNEGGRLA